MKIGILGVGLIGKTLTQKLSAAGHDVKVANSRGPETVGADVLSSGGQAVHASDAVVDVDVIILSLPLKAIPDVKPLLAGVPTETVVVDTSNYYPGRDGTVDAIESGQVESQWVVEQLGRPVVKAWNAIGSDSFAEKGMPAGPSDRIAIPVAADSDSDRKVGLQLVEDTGFDGFDAGELADSWRQQPGSPCYCTELTRDQLPSALESADASRLPDRRDLAVAAVAERLRDLTVNIDSTFLVPLNRVLFM